MFSWLNQLFLQELTVKTNLILTDFVSASTAINLFVKAVLRENRIPFAIAASPDPFYNTANQEYVLKSVKELRDGKATAHELIEEDVDE